MNLSKLLGNLKNNISLWGFFFALVLIGGIVGAIYMIATNEYFSSGSGKRLVLFYAPWCPHCKDIMPTWDALMTDSTQGKLSVSVEKVDCDKNPEQATQNGVNGFPTIILFKGTDKVVYQGDRSKKSIENFVNSH